MHAFRTEGDQRYTKCTDVKVLTGNTVCGVGRMIDVALGLSMGS